MRRQQAKHSPLFASMICIYLLFVSSLSAEEIKLTFAQAKVYYTFAIINQVTWPNEDSLEQFTIGILGGDTELENAFQQKKLNRVRGKKVVFENINDRNFPAERYSIIFISDKSRSSNNEIFAYAKRSLIITDGYVEKSEQLFSLITKANNIKINLNRSNLYERGFLVSNELMLLAGTKEELGEQLNDKEKSLKALMEEVQEKEKSLNALNNQLEIKSKQLESAKIKLENNKMLASSLLKKIEISQGEQLLIKDNIELQNKLIKEKQDEIIRQENAILEFQSNINHNKTILEKQISQIEKQNNIIKNKTQTISQQQDWLSIILSVSIVFFVMIYFLVRAIGLRKKANRELALANVELHKLATTDGMTKLFNRRHFLEVAQNELIRQQRNQFKSAMLMMDIDSFKNINDTYGHIVGDQVIVSVAKTLKKNMRKYDLVGRFGGEEYAMMLVNCDIKLASEIAQRICDEIADHKIIYQSILFNISISIGLSQLSAEDTDVMQTLVRADKALYQAKQNGKNQVVIFQEQSL